MRLYIETSALLRWLLGAPRGEEVRALLGQAEHVFSSRLTLLEARRALIRASVLGEIADATAIAAAVVLASASSRWSVVEVTGEISERAAQRFPHEPVRTLDAVHLATVLFLTAEVGSVAVLSTDDRVRRNAALLGLDLALPEMG